MHWSTKTFMGFWFGLLLFAILGGLVIALVEPVEAGEALKLIGILVGFFAVGVILVVVGKWSARGDREIIAQTIQASIGANRA